MNSYINLVLDAEAAKRRLRRVFESASEPEIARESFFRKWWSNVQLRHGLKMGLSGVLALYLAELLRLQVPAWSLFAVIDDPSLCRFDRFEIAPANDRDVSRRGTWCMAG